MNINDNEFGNYLKEKRENIGISLRQFSKNIGISAPYYSDIEHGNTKPPENDKVEKIASLLRLNDDEANMLYNLASETHQNIPVDLNNILKSMTREQRFEFYNGLRKLYK